MNALEYMNGKKTYALGVGLLIYMAIQTWVNKTPINNEIVYAVLAAMGITMRHGVAKAEK